MWQKNKRQTWLNELQTGNVVAAPAEGVYGYCADPFNPTAVEKIYAIKQRNKAKGLIILIPDASHLQSLCPPLSQACEDAITQYWPCPQSAPITLILPAKDTQTFGPTIALRCPSTPYMQAYLTAWGAPLVSTSLNKSGEPPAVTDDDIPLAIKQNTLLLSTDWQGPPAACTGTPSRIFDPISSTWLR